MSSKLFNVGMYIRLSIENTAYRGEDSMSIENQQAMMSKFISVMPGWVEKKIYIDNGASGGNFNRKGFQDMMNDVRQGLINLVLVQDLSRFGRNYLEAGKYLEEELPSLGCRFVSLSDGIDTEDGESDIMPFLNAIHDYYLKNLSDRVKSVLTAKAKDGQKLCGHAPYGYDRNPEQKTRLIIDDYAAGIVKRIFEMRAESSGYASIAGALNKDKIIPPRLYYFLRTNKETPPSANCSDIWKERTIKQMLENEIYIGNTISFKNKARSYRDKKVVRRDKNEWIKVENTHTPIVDIELWNKVQEINKIAANRFAHRREPRLHLFSRIAVCPDCGKKLVFGGSKKRNKNGEIIYSAGYFCRTYNSSGKTACSRHGIREAMLKSLVLADIKPISSTLAKNYLELKIQLIFNQIYPF